MLKIRCPAQNYAWGRPGSTSEVASLAKSAGETVDETKPYAELWMGTHPSGPSVLASDGTTTLKGWLEAHPEALGEAVRQRYGSDLPFLFKVLSVETALSIQSHPDKALAERLHAERPQVYKDDNHKPEMLVATSDVEALCGFVPPEELREALKSTPELRTCVGDELATKLVTYSLTDDAMRKALLKESFTALMTCRPGTVADAVGALVARLHSQQKTDQPLSAKDRLALRLNAQYPNDVGVLCVYYLNYVTLKPGQGMFLAANVPHAYVSGEMVECMATSDNVLRAGLTPKLRDTLVLCESLTYEQGGPAILDGEEVQEHVRRYSPPFDEFEVARVSLPAGAHAQLAADPGPRLLLVQAGSATARPSPGTGAQVPVSENEVTLHRGDVYFLAAGVAMGLAAAGNALTAWVASCNQQLFERHVRLS